MDNTKHPQYHCVNRLIEMMSNNGFKCTHVDNGEESVTAEPVETICSVDVSWPYFEKNGERFSMMIVLGNDDSEIVSDYSCRDSDTFKEFDMIIDGHSDLYV